MGEFDPSAIGHYFSRGLGWSGPRSAAKLVCAANQPIEHAARVGHERNPDAMAVRLSIGIVQPYSLVLFERVAIQGLGQQQIGSLVDRANPIYLKPPVVNFDTSPSPKFEPTTNTDA